jgi:hypothetical protein
MNMLNPTLITIVLAVLTVLALAAADWFVWRMATGPSSYRPRLVEPLTVRDLANKLLAGFGRTGLKPAGLLHTGSI